MQVEKDAPRLACNGGDCGIQLRTRFRVTHPGEGGKPCPHDSEARTCNCDDCTKAQIQMHLLPSASAHGFTPATYEPTGGFPTSFGEQAACVLDKAEAVIDLVPAMFYCKEFNEKVGDPCYMHSISHLVGHLEQCCEGRTHFVLWKSDTNLLAFECSSLLRRGSLTNANSELMRSQIEAEAGCERTRRAMYCSSGQLAPLASHHM